MSEKGSVFQKGGGGTNFEQLVQTAFLTTLIIRGNVPCVASSELIELAFQVSNRGYQTDDLLAIAKSANTEYRLLFQIKHNISFTMENKIFKEVVSAFWNDYNNALIFDKRKDKLIIAKSGLTKDERNHLKSLFNWAVNHTTETDFISEVNRINGKKERLEVFREVLKEANNNIALNDKDLWEFLKCIDVLEYDFLNEGSVDRSYFLNLIKLSKAKNSHVTEKEIWDSIFTYASMLNKDGGSVTIESIKIQDFFLNFDTAQLSPYFRAIEKLKSDSKEILRPIKTYIGQGGKEFRLPRIETREEILDAIGNFPFTIVTGKPGVGKSAEIKEILEKNFPNASICVFRADQFNQSTLANVFSSQGVNETLQDIFSCLSLIPEKIIFIDSLEKLLESDPECAFKQFLALLKEHPEIKIIAASRKYAIDLITLKFGINKKNTTIVEIPTLNNAELDLFLKEFPQLSSVLKNDKIKNLLQSPKYLDFSILALYKSNDDYSNLSLTEFKEKLWNLLVVDATNTKNGLPIKRETAFMEIAVKRAKEMKLFTVVSKSDAEAIICLENDEIIFQENQNRKYSPTHDILEDWALVKFVSSKFEEDSKPVVLFNSLGNEPAIRRAFRLWIEDYLNDNENKVSELIKSTVSDPTIEKYWSDELLIAVFKSENNNSFFTIFEKDLLENNAILFNRCLHLIKTCCKESDQGLNDSGILLPIGTAWKGALLFIQKHLFQLDSIKLSIINFIIDWDYRLLFQYDTIENEELEASKFIIIQYLKEIEEEQAFWQERNIQDKIKNLILLLFGLVKISKEEIKQLISRAFTNKGDRYSWELDSFYKSVIENCLSGIGNQNMIYELPELIVETAWKEWKSIPQKDSDVQDDARFLPEDSLGGEECWGIRGKYHFFPSGIYKTPIYNLLMLRPVIGLEFIINFINYSIEFYINTNCNYKHKFFQIEIELNDQTFVKQWASGQLWTAYRGISVTSYALESLLMSFEKFLLEIACEKTAASRVSLKFVFDYVLKKSNNIAPLAVLVSVAIAYPDEVGDAMLPLLSIREFYEWDSTRAAHEISVIAPIDNRIPFAQKERHKSNLLPHRSKYLRGLRDFILYYQVNVRTLNSQVHQIFDKLKIENDTNEIEWKKCLIEMDIRNHKLGNYDENLGGFPIEPQYDKDVTEFIESKRIGFDTQSRSLNFSGQLFHSYENKTAISFATWLSCYKQYLSTEKLDILFDRPITLAVLGLRDFIVNLDAIQKEWCISIIANGITSILQNTFTQNYGLNANFNILEKKIALSSFHLLMQNVGESDKDEIIEMIILTLIAPFSEHEADKIILYIRETFSRYFADETKRIWFGVLKYSNYIKTNRNLYSYQDENSFKREKESERNFIHKLSLDKNLKLDLSEISLEKSDSYFLARTFVIIPYDTIDKDFIDFINHVLPIVLDDLSKVKISSRGIRKSKKFHYESIADIQEYLANLFLNANYSYSKEIFSMLVNSSSTSAMNYTDLVEFVENTLDCFVLVLCDYQNLCADEVLYFQQLTNFWSLWELLFELIPEGDSHPLTKKLLLDIRFLLRDFGGNPYESYWTGLDGKKEFYKKAFLEKGKNRASSVINVFSTIGRKELLPEGINWLTEVFKSNDKAALSLAAPSAERMIKCLFYDHISKIKNNKILIDNYLWILNKMVDLGSSNAYMFRENVITYKTYAM